MSGFASLKNRGNSFADLSKKIQQAEKGGSYEKDERIWELQRDGKTGVGEAIIRFLPESDGSTEPFVTLYTHGFKNAANKWFIENCPTTIGEECPVCQANSELWGTGFENDKNVARNRKRKLNYYANIYVVRDNANPENNGKVFLFRFGVEIMRMIKDKISPQFETDEPVNVFDLWNGANFVLRATLNQADMVTYENSRWEAPSQLLPTDDQLEKVWRSQHKLEELVDASKFKPYSELEANFNRIIGKTSATPSASSESETPKRGSAEERFNKPAEPDDIKPIMDTEPSQAQSSSADDDDEIRKYKEMLGIS